MMHEAWLKLRAPFAAYRHLQAGAYRSTCPVIPHTAAWGLVLNICGIDARADRESVTTVIDINAPSLEIAIGVIAPGEVSSLYQHLHSYPSSEKPYREKAKTAHGAKYWIAPVTREMIVDFDCLIGIRSHSIDLKTELQAGLAGERSETRYGLPFAGDNNFLFDEISVLNSPQEAHWYIPVPKSEKLPVNDSTKHDDEANLLPGSCRLTTYINRANSGLTRSELFVPTVKLEEPPKSTWITVSAT